MNLNLIAFLKLMLHSDCALSASNGIITTEAGDTLDITSALSYVHIHSTNEQGPTQTIERLSAALHATQTAHSQTMQYAETTTRFIEELASLRIWGYDNNDGVPYRECREPSDGFLDSHYALMSFIENARATIPSFTPDHLSDSKDDEEGEGEE